MVEQQKHDVGDIKPTRIWIAAALRNKFTGYNVKIKFSIKTEKSTEETDKLGDWKFDLNQYLQGQQGESSRIQLVFTPNGWNYNIWGGDDPASWGEEESKIPEEMYRQVTLTINVKNSELQDVSISDSGSLAVPNPDPKDKPSDISEEAWKRAVESIKGLKKPKILLLLPPVWIKAQGFSERPKSSEAPSLIVVHHTSGSFISGAINHFTRNNADSSAHYLIDRDGRILKMVMNSKRAWHADGKKGSYWRGRKQVNGFSIGIEIVHSDGQGDFTSEQYEALITLIKKLREKYDTIPAWGIVGHSDVQIPPTHQCPGPFFDWKRLEDEGLGLKPDPDYKSSIEKNIFPIKQYQKKFSDEEVKVIEDLKDDLRKIGYFLPEENGYGPETATAINRFKRHFFAGSRRPKDGDGKPIKWNKATDGRIIDFETALMIKAVRSYINKKG